MPGGSGAAEHAAADAADGIIAREAGAVLRRAEQLAAHEGDAAFADAAQQTAAHQTAHQAAAHGAGRIPEVLGTPHGFAGPGEYREFVDTMYSGLDRAGHGGTTAAFQGSSVTGVGFVSGRPFGPHSDFDIALGGPALFDRARELGVALRAAGTRTGPLSPGELVRLGLSDTQRTLSTLAGREVHFMVYDTIDRAIGRGPTILAHR